MKACSGSVVFDLKAKWLKVEAGNTRSGSRDGSEEAATDPVHLFQGVRGKDQKPFDLGQECQIRVGVVISDKPAGEFRVKGSKTTSEGASGGCDFATEIRYSPRPSAIINLKQLTIHQF